MELTVKEINQLKQDLHESSIHMKKEIVKNEDAVVFLGGTKAGKSTLINYVIGSKLKAEIIQKYLPVVISKEDVNSPGPDIGTRTASETTIPTRCISDKLPQALWDAAGFGDNRGPSQDISNSFYLYQLLKAVRSLKIVLVVDINSLIHDDVKPFLSVLVSVENLLGYKMADCFSSIVIVFTKVPEVNEDGFPVTVQYISEILSFKFLLNSGVHMSPISKAFIEYISSNSHQITLFKKPKPGPVTSAIDGGIFDVIQNSSQIDQSILKKVTPSISDHSKIILFKSREKLFSMEVYAKLDKLVAEISTRKMDDLETIGSDEAAEENIKAQHSELLAIEAKLFEVMKQTDFYQQVKALKLTDSAIKDFIERDALLENVQLKEFVDKLLGLQENKELLLQIQRIISSWISRVKKCISLAQLKLGEITEQKYNELLEVERRKHQQRVEEINIELRSVKMENEEAKKSFTTKFIAFLERVFLHKCS